MYNEEKKKKAYMGKKINIKHSRYILLPEQKLGCCTGCDLIGKAECTKAVTELCRQGYILKKYYGLHECKG